LTPGEISDKFLIWVTPYATESIVGSVVDWEFFDHLVFRGFISEISKNDLECGYLTGEFIVLEFWIYPMGDIICWLQFPDVWNLKSWSVLSRYLTIFLLFLDLWIFEQSCLCEYIFTRSNSFKGDEEEGYADEMRYRF
jgi:hypothetical protein